jgi:K+-sensing histidine kinase KdpD
MKILVVEDNEDSRIMLCGLLNGAGYKVMEAPDGIEALASIQESTPDLIISDILMPEMDGFELCLQVKANPELQNIPFVFYTATYTEARDKELALSLGASKFLVKPIEPNVFLDKIRNIIEEHEKSNLSASKPTSSLMSTLEDEHVNILTNKLYKKDLQVKAQANFIHETAHDFRCPLSIILGYSTLIQRDSAVDLKKIKKQANTIKTEAEILTRMVNNLVEFLSIELGHGLVMQKQPTDIAQLIQEKFRIFKDCYSTFNFELDCPNTSLIVNLDKDKFGLVIDNLYCNAMKYSKPNTSIGIKLEPREDGIVITIRDEGRGMSQEEVSKMFDKFYRAPGVAGTSGMGLGATIIKHIIDEHKGKISVKSIPDKGTTVYIELPK